MYGSSKIVLEGYQDIVNHLEKQIKFIANKSMNAGEGQRIAVHKGSCLLLVAMVANDINKLESLVFKVR